MRGLHGLGLGLLAVVLASGCSTAMQARGNGLNGYYEVQKDGRYYIAGTESGIKQLRKNGELTLSVTRIGQGPGRATVVLETEAKSSAVSDALWSIFQNQHRK